MKFLFLFIITFSLPAFAVLNFQSNHSKEVKLLRSFDISPSFLNDIYLNKITEQKRARYKNKYFFKTMNDAYIFIPLVKKIISDADVPSEILYLAMAESNFSTRAYSKKRASGMWQFMPYTGRMYGLKIDDYVDERRDLVKSTEAAVKYLSYLHKKFGKWYLAAIAYNCGEGRLRKAIRRAGTDDLSALLNAKKKYLPRESRRYIRKIIALALIGYDESYMIENECDYLLNRGNAYSLATVFVPAGESLNHVAKQISIPTKELKKLNRHLKYDFVPPYGNEYAIYIPYIKLSEFKTNYSPAKLQTMYLVHTVTSGDNLSYLGKKYSIPYGRIKDFNHLRSDALSLKQKLIIPVSKTYKPKKMHYTVRNGDTLDSISKLFKLSIADLKKINKLRSDMIRIGDKLSVR
ncbi:LysM peptidoglycan-binding domain-containing protein [Sulfurimonas sp. MAG313]|nr:lytic transglycosylase domain-containing protein [Sulfurimonas sp. MAG313]MDF1880574.1 LysM peptidoglycan-binding domain-containing protein [Sulfurimonas sp. MAG313]